MEEKIYPEGPTYNWCAITDEFVEDCKHLELGELLHDSS